ncbi:MAG TPA: putative collagen-binding domain-containing protein, partial [Steroidobacteraceae bacterium]|nr:putative collagen-binding domain-containing protein [Steroidobacteraceae bacterium]
SSPMSTNKVLRAQMYQPMLAGSTGFVYGNVPLWFMGTLGDSNPGWSYYSGITVSWQATLGSKGASYVTRARQFFSSIAWPQLIPDVGHSVMTAGYGSVNNDSNAVLARSLDGHLAVAYLTTNLTLTVDMTKFASAVTASWYDPTSGATQSTSALPIANTGSHNFTPPASNAEGSDDWVLLLQTN